MQGLQSAHGILQRAVARELRLKHTPTLEFLYDDTAERGRELLQRLESLGAADAATAADDNARGRQRHAGVPLDPVPHDRDRRAGVDLGCVRPGFRRTG